MTTSGFARLSGNFRYVPADRASERFSSQIGACQGSCRLSYDAEAVSFSSASAVSISKLCRWIGVSRRTVYYRPMIEALAAKLFVVRVHRRCPPRLLHRDLTRLTLMQHYVASALHIGNSASQNQCRTVIYSLAFKLLCYCNMKICASDRPKLPHCDSAIFRRFKPPCWPKVQYHHSLHRLTLVGAARGNACPYAPDVQSI